MNDCPLDVGSGLFATLHIVKIHLKSQKTFWLKTALREKALCIKAECFELIFIKKREKFIESVYIKSPFLIWLLVQSGSKRVSAWLACSRQTWLKFSDYALLSEVSNIRSTLHCAKYFIFMFISSFIFHEYAWEHVCGGHARYMILVLLSQC